MQRSYKIGKYEFKNAISYYAGRKDVETIQYIQSKFSLNEDNVEKIYGLIREENLELKTCIGTDYLRQLDTYRIQKQQQRKKQKKRSDWQKFIRINVNVLMSMTGLLFLCVVLFAGNNAYSSYSSNKEIEKLRGEIATEISCESEEIDEDTELVVEEPLTVLPEYQTLYEQNSDLIGWLSITGTNIDYPVMWKSGDNNFYLSHNYDGQEDKNGLLVLDYRCDVNNEKMNYLIHGHNMRSGTMFGSLKKYKEKEYYEQHKIISFNTIYERQQFEIMAVIISQVMSAEKEEFKYYDCLEFRDSQEYDEFIINISEMSLYETDIKSHYGDVFIMLSTCDYSKENGRLVVIARKMEDNHE